jgi:hypothetical protein
MSLKAAHLTFYAVMIQKYWRGVADRKKVGFDPSSRKSIHLEETRM